MKPSNTFWVVTQRVLIFVVLGVAMALSDPYQGPAPGSGVSALTSDGSNIVAWRRVTLPTLADMATGKLLGRSSASTGVVEELTTLPTAVVVGAANLGGGTGASSSTYLRGDMTWVTPSGGSGDMLSTLANSEVSITTTATATISKMHVCTGTSADYTVTLPAVSGNTGKFIGFRMGSGLTKLVTLDGNASETIDGATTRVMWANETAILMCDGTTWTKIAGKSIPMYASMYRAGAQTGVVTATVTKVTIETDSSSAPSVMANTGSNRIDVVRTGNYSVIGTATHGPNAGTGVTALGTNFQVRVNSGTPGSTTFRFNDARYQASGGYASCTAQSILSLTAGDAVDLYVFQNTGSNQDLYTSDPVNRLTIIEVPQW